MSHDNISNEVFARKDQCKKLFHLKFTKLTAVAAKIRPSNFFEQTFIFIHRLMARFQVDTRVRVCVCVCECECVCLDVCVQCL